MLPTVFGKHLKIVDGDLWKAGRHMSLTLLFALRSYAVMHLAASRYTTEQCDCLEGDSQHQASPTAIVHLITSAQLGMHVVHVAARRSFHDSHLAG